MALKTASGTNLSRSLKSSLVEFIWLPPSKPEIVLSAQ